MDNATEPTVAETEESKKEKLVPDLTGSQLGDYVLLRRLGLGGMGQVYLAEQVSLKRKVALKLLKSELAANETALERFKREAMAVARATHANIVQVYAIHEEKGLHFMALEYVEGRNLRDYLEKKGPPEVLISIGILRQVAAALQRASELGVIHRDVKPENILITRKGEVKVADFGLSRIFDEGQQPLNLTQSGVTMGTPLYMSPEQVEGKTLDPRTDIYSLGATAYHLLAGEPPFRGQTPFEVAVQHVQKEAPALQEIRPDLPPELCQMVHRMMAKKPEERYQTAKDIVRDLLSLRDHLVGLTGTLPAGGGIVTGPVTPVPAFSTSDNHATLRLPAVPPARTVSWLSIAAALLMLSGGVALGVWWNQHRPDTTSSSPTKEAAVDPERKDEQKWLEQFKTFEKAPDRGDLGQGVYACIRLTALYLDRGLRAGPKGLKELEQFAQQLQQINPPQSSPGKIGPYRYLGEFGEAIALAFNDEPDKSNELFVRLLKKPGLEKPKVPIKKLADEHLQREIEQAALYNIYLKDQKHFRKLLAAALQRNHDNLPKAFPPQLELYRKLPQ